MGKELRDLRRFVFLYFFVEALHDHLAQSFAGAHDVGGIDRFVRGYQDKALAAVEHGRIGRLVCTDGVVLDCLAGAVLHERYMLMCCRVIYDLRMILGENVHQTAAVTHGTDQGLKIQVRVLFLQLELDSVGIIFVNVENDELFGLVSRDLTAEL